MLVIICVVQFNKSKYNEDIEDLEEYLYEEGIDEDTDEEDIEIEEIMDRIDKLETLVHIYDVTLLVYAINGFRIIFF